MNTNYHYPEHILRKLREICKDLDPRDTDYTNYDEEFNQMSPEEVFQTLLEYEGIYGYAGKIMSWVESIYGVALRPSYTTDAKQSRKDFVRGLGNFFRAFPRNDSDGVESMVMDEREIVHVLFDSGHTKRANVAMDSRRSIIADIINQALK